MSAKPKWMMLWVLVAACKCGLAAGVDSTDLGLVQGLRLSPSCSCYYQMPPSHLPFRRRQLSCQELLDTQPRPAVCRVATVQQGGDDANQQA